MEKELWKEIALLFTEMDAGIAALEADEQLDPETVMEAPDNNILQVRESVRKQLDLLRISLSGRLTDQESYYILFAIVIYIDENIRTKVLEKAQLAWPLLQKELFDIDDGGNLFYDTLDHILKKPEISLFVSEVFYFCLKHGFQGRYIDDPVTIADYMKTLELKIKKDELPSQTVIPEKVRPFPYLIHPAWYYGTAVFFLICVYMGFRMF